MAWGERKVRVNVRMKPGGGNSEIVANQMTERRKSRMQFQINYSKSYPINEENKSISGLGGSKISNLNIGLEDEELIGLDLVDCKRAREGPNYYETMVTIGGLKSV